MLSPYPLGIICHDLAQIKGDSRPKLRRESAVARTECDMGCPVNVRLRCDGPGGDGARLPARVATQDRAKESPKEAAASHSAAAKHKLLGFWALRSNALLLFSPSPQSYPLSFSLSEEKRKQTNGTWTKRHKSRVCTRCLPACFYMGTTQCHFRVRCHFISKRL